MRNKKEPKVNFIDITRTTIVEGKRYARTSVLSVKEEDISEKNALYLISLGKAIKSKSNKTKHVEEDPLIVKAEEAAAQRKLAAAKREKFELDAIDKAMAAGG